jgi:UDP-3-O-[3-hydroxymyristoyl] N-acetylglucosamine deacetylase
MKNGTAKHSRPLLRDVSVVRPPAICQKTLKNEIHCTGIGLHSGAHVLMTLKPAAPDSGIVFKRSDLAGDAAWVPATWDRVGDTRMCTALINDHDVRVGTVEHLLAALAGCEVDNAVIEIDGPEVPIMDGSAAPFVFLIECAGLVEQDVPRRAIKVLKPVSVVDGERRAKMLPGDGFSVSFEIEFDSAAVSRQRCSFRIANGTFKSDICRARTFGFLHEVDQLREAGLARGGSLDNAVVVNGDKVMNEGGLRYKDEFVRHKVLDFIGDLYLAGAPIIGHVAGFQSGHSLNNKLLRALFEDDEAWRYIEAEQASVPPMVVSEDAGYAARA